MLQYRHDAFGDLLEVSGIAVDDDAAIPVIATTFVAAWLILIGEGDNYEKGTIVNFTMFHIIIFKFTW